MDELKKALLADIGLTSMTLEKADVFVKELVEKGCLIVKEGKELQSELKRKSEDETEELLDQLDVKTKTVQYATKEDASHPEDKLDASLKQPASDDKERDDLYQISAQEKSSELPARSV